MKTLIADTCEVIFTRKSDGKPVITGDAQLASLQQQVTETKVKGGVGNRTIGVLRSDKEVTLQVKSATFDLEYLAMVSGAQITANGTATVKTFEENLEVVDNSGTLSVAITGTPVDNKVQLVNEDGEVVDATCATGSVTIPDGFAVAGDLVTVVYQKEVTGKKLTISSDKFSENFEVQYRTIEYDPDTNKVVNDLYIDIYNASPSGAFELSFENGTALAPQMTFNVLDDKAHGSEIGQIVEVPRTVA